MTNKNYPFIYANTRFLQKSFYIYRALNMYQKVVALEVLEKDIKGLNRRERIKEEKSLKLKTLRNIYIKLCSIILHISYI